MSEDFASSNLIPTALFEAVGGTENWEGEGEQKKKSERLRGKDEGWKNSLVELTAAAGSHHCTAKSFPR